MTKHIIMPNDDTEEEVLTTEEVTTTEEKTESQDDVLTLKGDDKAEYEKWRAKKEQRQQFVEKANSQPKETIPFEKLERIELRQDGYSKEEVDAIMELGGSKALKNPVVAAAIEVMRKKAKSEDASLAPSSHSPVYKKFTQADLKGMSSAELEKILPHD